MSVILALRAYMGFSNLIPEQILPLDTTLQQIWAKGRSSQVLVIIAWIAGSDAVPINSVTHFDGSNLRMFRREKVDWKQEAFHDFTGMGPPTVERAAPCNAVYNAPDKWVTVVMTFGWVNDVEPDDYTFFDL